MRPFDFYEFAGVIAPGAVVLYVLWLILPDVAPFLTTRELSIGSLGLFVILAYVAGHLVQAVGNGLEKVVWLRGMPTDLVRRTDQNLISREQRDHLAESVQAWLNVRLDGPLKEVSAEEWLPITRQMYAAVAAAGRTGRIDTFNGNYGMFRRLASAFLISAVANTIVNWPPSHFATSVLLLAAVLSVIRICRFARHYARELFVQFLQISIGTKV